VSEEHVTTGPELRIDAWTKPLLDLEEEVERLARHPAIDLGPPLKANAAWLNSRRSRPDPCALVEHGGLLAALDQMERHREADDSRAHDCNPRRSQIATVSRLP
jgi:hypothetical protein